MGRSYGCRTNTLREMRNAKMHFSFGVDRFRMNSALQITSCVFLLMTLLVYACLPSLQNLHGKTLMCHVSSILLAFICLPLITWMTDTIEQQSIIACRALGSFKYADT